MINRSLGQVILSEKMSISQSIEDILTTPVGSRVMRREYGSLLPFLIDQPTNDAVILQLYSAIYVALLRWEDRINIEKIAIEQLEQGKLVLYLETVEQQAFNVDLSFNVGAL